MTIGGANGTAGAGYPVDNPATGATVGVAPECSPAQLDQAHHVAQRAAVQLAVVAIEILAERLDHTARRAGFGGTGYGGDGLADLLLVGRLSTGAKSQRQQQ